MAGAGGFQIAGLNKSN